MEEIKEADDIEMCRELSEDESIEEEQEPRWCSVQYDKFLSFFSRESDSASERTAKKILVPLSLFGGVFELLFAISYIPSGMWVIAGLNFIRALCCFIVFVHIFLYKRIIYSILEPCLIGFVVFFALAGDLSAYGKEDLWTGSVLIADLILLTKCSSQSGWVLIVMTTLYIIVKTIEEGVGLGIYNAIPESWTGTEPRPTEGTGWMTTTMPTRLLVFVLDFLMTRRFALGMRSEQQKSEAAVLLAQKVAGALVRFDLETAEHLVKNAEKSELNKAFLGLLSNLKLYRPYLPDALFAAEEVAQEGTGVEGSRGEGGRAGQYMKKMHHIRQIPAGSGQEEVTIVFTDIQSSTDIWERHTSAMRTAMEIHNDVMRECITATNGYEVKTIGDAFMVAFDKVVEGVRFGLLAQGSLLRAPWPAALLEHPLCKVVGREEDGSLCWRGLRVRIGVHTGPARLELNPTTGRTDYMGPTVNKAARVESASAGGAVAFTEEVQAQLSNNTNWGEGLSKPVITKMGSVSLKGVGNVPLFITVPTDLGKRQVEVEKILDKRRFDQMPTSPTSPTSPRSPAVMSASVHSHSRKSTSVFGEARTQHITRNRLTASTATTMHIRVDFSCLVLFTNAVDAVNEILNIIIEGVERTEGLLNVVCSNSIIANWNAGKPCAMHVAQSAKFVSHLYSSISGAVWERFVSVGMSTGRVLHGSLGSAKQRFVTSLGSGVEEGRALAEAASQLGTLCLLAGESCAGTDTSLQVHTRPVDTWKLPREVVSTTHVESTDFGGRANSNGIVTQVSFENSCIERCVYELNLKTFSLVDGVWNLFDGVVGEEWGARYKEAFNDRDVEELRLLSDGKDRTMEKVISVMEGTMMLARPFNRGLVVPQNPAEGWAGEATGTRIARRRSTPFR